MMLMKRTIFLSAAVAAALSMSAALPCRAGEARRAPDAADRFKTVFSWGCVTDEETARAYAGIGVTDVFYKGAEGLAAARKHGLRAYCAFGPHGNGPQVLTPEQQKRFDHLSGADLRGRTPSGPELDRVVNERRAAAKCQYGGEPVAAGDLCPESIPCFLGDTDCAASFAALAKTLAENPEADGIAFDYIGYTNLRSCECDGCKARLAAWLKEHGLEENEANRDRFFREGLVGYVNALVAEAKRIRPGIRVAIHLYPVFLPDPLYGRDLTADYVQETAAWYFPWPEEKIADYTRRIVSAERRPGSVGMPFVGLNATPGMPLEAKTPERLEAELRLILANGGDRVAVCGGDDMLKPGYREVFRKFTAGATWWAVPAMSGVQRLPDSIPADGEEGGTVRIVAARGEYEPGSFVVRADADLGNVQPVVGRFVNENGDVFPADALDLTVVKVWYQNKNGWFSYFADTGFKLCPELLLHDEDLVRVDTAKEANYARVTGPDGKTSEWWLNPPRLLNGRYYDHFVPTTAFPSMRPGFADAKTIQPVALEKDVSKQFFLTAHVAPGTPAGTYRGTIDFTTQPPNHPTVLSVPVAIRVLDFELPKPMAYADPGMDFRVCFYDYISRGQILALNGGDEELMWKQMEAILADAVAHGQDMKWIPGATASAEAERTIAIMKKVGMRTDVFVGGVDFVWKERDAAASRARAERIADYYDRTYGHHDVYGGYGDEPGLSFFPDNRPIFDAYQAAGLKFIIASHDHIFDLAGYRWNWHNASRKPTDPTAPSVWNKIGTGTYSAWYADQHVGAEDPELSRRQNGLGAWLSGYSALCNYAHHLGPWNDDSETYKPMVFAYGTADGVIDTLQWEGFREGVDDIRYATLLMALAREAEKSGDIEVRYLAGKAKVLLARFDAKTGDLNAARGEMVGFIEKLRAALGDRANLTIAAAKRPGVERKPYPPASEEPAPADPKALADYYARRYRVEEQIDVLRKNGFKTEAAKVLFGRSAERSREAVALAAEGLADAAAARDRARFLDAWSFLLDNAPEAADRHAEDAVRVLGATAAADEWLSHGAGLRVAYDANWARLRREYGLALETDGASTNRLWSFKVVQYAIPAWLETGDARCAYKPEDVYLLRIAKAVCGAKDEAAVAAALAEADRAFGEGIDPKKRKERLERLGSFAMCANDEAKVRGVADYLDTVFTPKPDKTYVVRFSPVPVLGLGGWDAAAAAAKPGTEKLDRAYGGDASCLWTDVATQRGAVDAGANGGYARVPEWQALADEWGLHFRLEVFDEKAKEIALGLASVGSLEGYLAPGANTPYHGILHSFQPGGLAIYNPVYSQPGHHEIDAKNRANCREEVACTENSVVLYWAFPWTTWATRVPTADSVWDFEPMFWGRKGSCSWNGLKTIHGRSSWGRLAFALTDAESRRILRPVLAAARRSYEAEKGPTGACGIWRNAEVGDPAFYESVLAPLVEKLDAAAARVSADMDDATVDELAATALPAWHDFAFEVQRLRADYLLR